MTKSSTLCGYHGRYLRVDVGTQQSQHVALDETTLRRFVGGAGLGVAILLREGCASIDALAPESHLVFALSPLVGSPLTTSAKFAVVSKSPLTNRLNDSLASSGFAIAAKKTGVDAITITGRASELSIVIVDDDVVRIEPSPQLAGLTCDETAARLSEEHGNDYQSAAIGPAGERQVRYATISHDGRHAGRGGSGAVLGAKNIKAILVRGTRRCDWAEPQELVQLAKTLSGKSLGPATSKYRELGTAANVLLFNRLQSLPTRNFQEGSFAEAEALAPETLTQAREKTRGYCAACTIGCEHMYALKVDGEATESVRVEYENLFALGSLCGIGDADAVLRACKLCDDYGIDTISAGGTIAFAMECVERGYLDQSWLRFGDSESLLRAIREIGTGEGFGSQLALGSRTLASKIGRGSIDFAPQVKGLEIPGYEPRALQHMALGFAVSPRGADHNRSGAYEADFSSDHDRFSLTDQSALAAIETEDRATLMDSLIICKFLRGVFVDFYEEASEMLRLVTGWNMTSEELRTIADRVVTAKKLFNVRAGWTPAEDVLPRRFFAPSNTEGSSQSPIDEAAFMSAIAAYNVGRDWSEEGYPQASDIESLGLADFAQVKEQGSAENC